MIKLEIKVGLYEGVSPKDPDHTTYKLHFLSEDDVKDKVPFPRSSICDVFCDILSYNGFLTEV